MCNVQQQGRTKLRKVWKITKRYLRGVKGNKERKVGKKRKDSRAFKDVHKNKLNLQHL